MAAGMVVEASPAGVTLRVALEGFPATGVPPGVGEALPGIDELAPDAGVPALGGAATGVPRAILSPAGTVSKAFDQRDVTAEKRPLPGQLQTPISSSNRKPSRSQRRLSLLQPVGISSSRITSIAIHAIPLSGSDTCDSFSAQRLLCWRPSIMT